MEIGIVQIMQSFGYDNITDAEVYEQETRLAVLADELGYDHVWTVEHHFEDYSFCPDNFVYLANLAAKTERIGLATGACIVPWNIQPLRIAEKAALLDLLSGGRAILGLGRGLSRREFTQFGIAMDESRDRFDEAAPLILEALETGFFPEHNGKHIKQPKAPLRPRPMKSWKDRVTQVAMSPESGEEAAKLGAQMMAFNYKAPDKQRQECADYAASFRKHHGKDPRPPLLTDMAVCDSDPKRAKEHAEKYVAGYCLSVLHHYEMLGEHYKEAKGYKAYGDAVDMMRALGKDGIAKAYIEQQVWGTPDQMLRKFEERWNFMGPYGVLCSFRFAGMPPEVSERSIKLFAKEVLPVLRTWTREQGPKQASEAA
ncbi:MAG: LLM class flavin-dependent oxidoreductase [Gammaproteobacteria bacterium]|nr:LLM class flavin-dependent oxidoreductase [Gammaproteobacteria bacterium]